MYVASVRAELHLPFAGSLKDKRAVLNKLKDRLRNAGFAVAEVDHAELWQRAALGLAVVTSSAARLDEALASARDIVAGSDSAQVLDWVVSHHE